MRQRNLLTLLEHSSVLIDRIYTYIIIYLYKVLLLNYYQHIVNKGVSPLSIIWCEKDLNPHLNVFPFKLSIILAFIDITIRYILTPTQAINSINDNMSIIYVRPYKIYIFTKCVIFFLEVSFSR